MFARPPAHRLPQRTPPAPSRDSLLGFGDHGTSSQSRPLPSRHSEDIACRAASVASTSDFEGWELTDTAWPSSEKRMSKIGCYFPFSSFFFFLSFPFFSLFPIFSLFLPPLSLPCLSLFSLLSLPCLSFLSLLSLPPFSLSFLSLLSLPFLFLPPFSPLFSLFSPFSLFLPLLPWSVAKLL